MSKLGICLAVMMVVCMIASPVLAADYTITGYQEFNVFDVQKDYYTQVTSVSFDKGTEDKAITSIHFNVPQDHTVTYTLYYGAANSVTGTAANAWNLSLLPLQITTSTIVFNGETKSYSYLDTNPEYDYYLSGYARSTVGNETGLIVYNAGYGSFDNNLAIFMPVSNLAGNLIYRVDLSSDVRFDADISYGSAADVAASVNKNIIEVAGDWINFAISIAYLIYNVVTTLLYWLKFFFFDNLGMTVALYLSISMAYSASTSKDIFRFFGKFFNDQRKFFEFILGMWRFLVELVGTFRGIFRI